MSLSNKREWIHIPSHPIGSITRTDRLIKARIQFESDLISVDELRLVEKEAVEQTINELDRLTGSLILTDGEQTKPSFLTYPIYDLIYKRYRFDDKCVKITFSDGHVRTIPRLIKAPFEYATYAYKYLNAAKTYTTKGIKQAVITPSALSLVYTPAAHPECQIENYSRQQFLNDLLNESEKDIRLCLENGAELVQLDFTEARLSLKIDPTGQLLKEFIRINNQVLDRFTQEQQKRIGVHVCPGGDFDACHSFDVDYTLMLPDLFELHLANFYLQFCSEKDRIKVLKCINKYLKKHQRIFVGVTDPINPQIETPESVCRTILEAATFIPLEQLGTTDDCGFSPFADDTSTPRHTCFAKIEARIKGTLQAEQILNEK